MNERFDMFKALLEAFKVERHVYLILTALSALSLIAVAIYLAFGKHEYQSFFALLVPSGTITACVFRILKMWDDAIDAFFGDNSSR